MPGRAELMRMLCLLALIAICAPMRADAQAQVIGDYVWNEDFDQFGGFSGLWVSDDGNSFVTVSDRGSFVEGTFDRDGAQILGVEITKRGVIHGPRGPEPPPFHRDAEGLGRDGNGHFFVSFEGLHRVSKYTDGLDAPPEPWLHQWDYFIGLQQNSGFEALATDANGTVYAIPERSGEWTRPYPVYMFQNGEWTQTLSLDRTEKYLVTGADFGPDGALYVLERLFEWYGGFSSRIRRFDLGPDGFSDGSEVLRTNFGQYGNLEGISVWQNVDGQMIATLISDDNFNVLQSTRFVEVVLDAPVN